MKEMTEQDRQRIEKEANEWVDYNSGGAFHLVPSQTEGYIAGATAENERMAELLKEERNKAIDECIDKFDKQWKEQAIAFTAHTHYIAYADLLKQLESLKSQ